MEKYYYKRKGVVMKKILLVLGILLFCFTAFAQTANAKKEDPTALNKNLKVLTKGEAIAYPIENGTTIECYAKLIDGSIDAFKEYNDYFYMKDGVIYSDTMRKLYQPDNKELVKKVKKVKLVDNGKTLRLYDPLSTWSLRRHVRVVKINLETGEYFMKGAQDNWEWYRNVVATGYCRAIKP